MKSILKPIAFLVVTGTLASPLRAQNCVLERATHSHTGGLSNGDSAGPSLSTDGRFVAYASSATNLVLGDTNGKADCFVTDRWTDTTVCVSVDNAGVQGDGWSTWPKITPDGRFVTFLSESTNLDPKDIDTLWDVYIHDRRAKTTVLVSERLGSGPLANGCYQAESSSDGRWVLFGCSDGNVLPGVLGYNAFVRDVQQGTTELVSVGPAGQVEFSASDDSTISGDGRYVAFTSPIVDWFPHGPLTQVVVCLRDRWTATTSAVTLATTGGIANGTYDDLAMSAEGRYLAMVSTASNLLPPGETHSPYDVVRWDRMTGQFVTVNKGSMGQGLNGQSTSVDISADGSKVVYYTFASNATTYFAGYTTIILADMVTGVSALVNVNAAGAVSNTTSYLPCISPDGRSVAFTSYASNLVNLPSNGVDEVYVRSCDVASPMVYCTPVAGPTGCTMRIKSSGAPSVSAGAGFVLKATGLPTQQAALFFYGTDAPWGSPLMGAFLCVKPPLRRTPGGSTNGTAACDGAWRLDFNAFVSAGGDPALTAGSPVYVQAWARNATGAGQVSDALAFVLEP